MSNCYLSNNSRQMVENLNFKDPSQRLCMCLFEADTMSRTQDGVRCCLHYPGEYCINHPCHQQLWWKALLYCCPVASAFCIFSFHAKWAILHASFNFPCLISSSSRALFCVNNRLWGARVVTKLSCFSLSDKSKDCSYPSSACQPNHNS